MPRELRERMTNVKSWLSDCLGRGAEICFPATARRIAGGDLRARDGRLGRLILRAQTRRAARTGAWDTLGQRLNTYWQGPDGDRFYTQFPERFEQWFLGPHRPWADALVDAAANGPFTQLIEIGCGDGRVLANLAERLPRIDSFTGLDLNQSVVGRNRSTFAQNPRLHFETGDARQQLPLLLKPGTVIVTYGGVLEYVPPADLLALFSLASGKAPSIWALVEPLAAGFDCARDMVSRATGLESSFSHPYRRMLEQAGWRIEYEAAIRIEHRWITLVARA